MPLVCLQITDAVEVAPDTWRFEFRSLNWTRFTDRPCPASDPTCIDRTSPGEAATGLAFVRSAGLSNVDFTVLPVDPNGAPLGFEPIMLDMEPLVRLSTGELALLLDPGFVAQIEEVRNDSGDLIPSTCYELQDPYDGVVVFSEDAVCGPLVSGSGQVEIHYQRYLGDDDADPNTWGASLCTEDQLIWTQDPLVDPDDVIPPADSNQPVCPTTCEEKESLGNTADGFVIEVKDFQPGDRLVFSWYFLGESGPIADGSPPTPTDFGTLRPSASDPWGFSFGSFQIDRKDSCLAGDCDTILLTEPPVTDPELNCLVSGLDRDQLPFDIYVSLSPAGTNPPCEIEPSLEADDKGLERLVVQATSGADTDQVTVVFRNLDTNVIDKQVRISDLTNASASISTSDLIGRYEVSGTCENTTTDSFFLLAPFDLAIPKRGDLADVAAESVAVEIEEGLGGLALTGLFDPGVLDLGDEVDICWFAQVRDGDGNVRIIGTSEAAGAESLTRRGDVLVRDLAPPEISCEAPIVVQTSDDGGEDCSVEVDVSAVARDDAGGFTLTNDLDPAARSRSFGASVGDEENAFQTATGVFSVGAPSTVSFNVVDDAAQAAQCSTTVAVEDDTAPVVGCSLVPDPPPPGDPADGQYFFVEILSQDNCDGAMVSDVADIDGIPVQDGDRVRITHRNSGPVEAMTQGDTLHILTNLGGILTVSSSDDAGNVGTCTSMQPCTAGTMPPPVLTCPDVEVTLPQTAQGFVDVPIFAMGTDGGDVPVTILAVRQDEMVTGPGGGGNTCPDAEGIGTETARVRAERLGSGDGRVYHIYFAAQDGGESCAGEVTVCVPRSQGNQGSTCFDQGALFSSTDCP